MAGKSKSAAKNEPESSSQTLKSGSSPSLRLIGTFVIAVVIGMTIQKALPALDIALSCHAKVLCSGHFLGHRSASSIDIGAECSSLVKWITNAEVHAEAKEVESNMLFGLLKQTAKYLGTYRGCALKGKEPLGPEPTRTRKRLSNPELPWPEGNAVDLSRDDDQSDLAVALDVAFERFKPKGVKSSGSQSLEVGKADDDGTSWNTREFVVVQGGKIVYEYYAPGFTPETALLGWSMSKTLMAALIGIRIGEGAMELDSKVTKWFPEWTTNNRSQITLDDLLTMQSGLQWLEGYTLGNGEVIPMLFGDESCSERPRRANAIAEPGKHFSYASGTSNLLSEVLRRSVKYDEAYWTYPARMLLEPIGADSIVLETDRTGTFNAAAFSYGNARDWARVGLLFLNDGVWTNGKRILPEGWVKYVTKPRSSSHGIYGAHFWLGGSKTHPDLIDYDHHLQDHAISSILLSNTTFTMTGFGGQFVSVIPEKNAVIVRLAHDPSRRHYGELISTIVPILPSQ